MRQLIKPKIFHDETYFQNVYVLVLILYAYVLKLKVFFPIVKA